MEKRKNGALVISLDFELFWGVFDLYTCPNQTYFNNTLEIIPKLLDLFAKYEIHATWATVGMLFNENKEEWLSNIPTETPNYENKKLDAYAHGKFAINKANSKYYFAPELVKKVIETPQQELSSHTYSHYYALEQGQNIYSFDADIKQAIKLGKKFNINIESLVFPRNQFNESYTKVCFDNGIKTLRSNPDSWYWKNTQDNSLGKRLFRLIDTYHCLDKKSYGINQVKTLEKVKLQASSRFLRPISSKSFLNNLRNQNIKKELKKTAKNGEIYHLWWHPHNFGNFPKESLLALEEILKIYKELKNQYGFESLSMRELYENI